MTIVPATADSISESATAGCDQTVAESTVEGAPGAAPTGA